jgi:multimeric flavodoxin WrbA
MNLCLLDAASSQDPTAVAARRAIHDRAAREQWTVQSFHLPDLRIADCVGDFNCWLKTPGVCSINDANRDVARGIAQSQLLVFLTPVSFGGYSSELKKALDHIVQVISPFFESVDGETHHKMRYAAHPRLVGIGLMDRADEEAAGVFHALVARNAANLQNDCYASGVLHRALDEAGIVARVDHLLDAADRVPHSVKLEFGPRAKQWRTPFPAPASAVLLSGSPRGARSSSASLGNYLLTQLTRLRVRTGTIEICRTRLSEADTAELLAATDAADLVILSCPLYADSLPTGVIRTLERIDAHRHRITPDTRSGAQRFMAIVQSGFPEPQHNHTALAICREFAWESRYVWAGGLALGGGHGLVQSKPLEKLGGKAAHVRKALDLTATALVGGHPVPDEAVHLFEKPFVPGWMYRAFGNLGWVIDAQKNGTRRQLGNRPYAPSQSAPAR